MFFQAQRAFKTGTLQKVVPVFCEKFDLPLALVKKRASALPFDLPKVLVQSEKSRQKTVSAFCKEYDFRLNRLFLLQNIFQKSGSILNGFFYGIWDQHSGFLGLTPEFLFSIRGENFETMALAGTAPHPGPSLLKDKKERREQSLVTQNIRESLQGFVQWKKHEVYEMPFGRLKHLRSDLSGCLNQKFSFEDICGKLHPTPALGGYPARRALEWLKRRSSQTEKRVFGAPFGFFSSSKEMFCLVALRALEWNGGEGRVFSGAGLLKESCLQKEWRELSLKRQQVKGFFLQ